MSAFFETSHFTWSSLQNLPMVKKVWFKLFDAASRQQIPQTQLACVDRVDGVDDIADLCLKILDVVDDHQRPRKDVLANVTTMQMMVYKNRNDYQARKRALSTAEQLQNLGKDEPNALIVEIALPRDVYFKLAGAGADAGMDFADSSVRLTDFNTINDIKQSALVLCQAILAGYAPPKDIPTNVMLMQMKVYRNQAEYEKEERRQLTSTTQLLGLGKDEPNALIVEIALPRDVYFKLAGAGADAGMDFADSSVRLTDFNTINDIKQSALVLCQAILAGYAPPKDIPTNVMLMQMKVYRNQAEYEKEERRQLTSTTQLLGLGKDEPNALIVEIALPRDVYFKLAGAGADAGMDFADSSVRLTDFNTINDIKQSALVLCQAILAGYAPPKDIPTNVMLMQMKVYRNQAEYEKEERRQLTSTTQLLGLGNDEDNVLIVEVSLPPRERDVFFELAGADAGIDFTNTRAASVRLTGSNSINDLKREVLGSCREILTGYMPNDLVVYANKDSSDALIEHTQIMRYGASATSALVVKVPSQPSKRVKLLWQKTLTFELAASTLPLGEECRVWQIDSTTIAGFGICESDENLVLFCRDDATKLVRFLQDEVVHEGKTGYILGPPGSGKSTTAAAFALALVRASAWIVTWIHLYRDAPPTCVRLEGNKKKITKVEERNALETLDQILKEVDDAKQHIVFLDGVTGEDGDKVRLCTGWLRNRWSTCRLVIVNSMSTREKVKLDDDRDLKIQEFLVSSWTWEEYVAAIQDETLFQAVQGHLDAFDGSMPGDVSLKDLRESLLLSKYYFAGGSARYMFGFPTATVIKSLDEAVEAVDNVQASAAGSLGCRSARMINRLYGQFGDTRGLISRYAASSLTILGGGELIKRFASILRKDSNAAMEGWILEMYFFACIRGNGVSVYEGETEIKFPRCDIVTVDVGTRTNRKKLPKLPTKCWLKPKQFNQGGYDAVYIDQDEKLVRFVQLTKSDRHSFRIEFFSVLLTSLVEAMSEVKMLDIFFVVEKQSLCTFEFSTVTGQGNLLHYGWLQGKETDKVRRVAIEGVESWDVLKW